MDVRAVKLASPIDVPWPPAGGIRFLRLYPLSDAAIDACGVAESQVERGLSELRAMLSIVAASLRVNEGDLAARVTPPELAYLFRHWMHVQKRAWPRGDRLAEWLRKSICDHVGVMSDAVLAMQAEDASTFYGRPAIELTRGQVSYFVGLRNAYDEWYGSDKVKTPTDEYLESDKEGRLSWQMNNEP